jgi:hypothetical protein
MTCRRLRLRDSRVCGSASDRRSFVRFGFRRTEPACEPLGGRLARPDQSRAGSASRARILEAAQASIRVCVTLPPSSVDLAHSHRQLTPPSHSANSLRQATPPSHSAKPLRQATPPARHRQHQSANTLCQARDCQFKERQPKCAKSFLEWKPSEMPSSFSELTHQRRVTSPNARPVRPTPPTALRQPHSASPLRQLTPPTHSANSLRQARDCQFEERQLKCAKSFLVWKFPEKPLPPSRKSLIRGELRLRMLGP